MRTYRWSNIGASALLLSLTPLLLSCGPRRPYSFATEADVAPFLAACRQYGQERATPKGAKVEIYRWRSTAGLLIEFAAGVVNRYAIQGIDAEGATQIREADVELFRTTVGATDVRDIGYLLSYAGDIHVQRKSKTDVISGEEGEEISIAIWDADRTQTGALDIVKIHDFEGNPRVSIIGGK